MSVNSKMTAIANATRALDGSTAALTLDGIVSKLGVEKTNIAAALAAIAEKGVEVPSGSTSDALAGLIASIESGGGKIVSGSWTQAANSVPYTVTHDLGEVPDFAICVKASNGTFARSTSITGCIYSTHFSAGLWTSATYSFSTHDITENTGYGVRSATESTLIFYPYDSFMAGQTYQWYAGVI